MNTLDFSTVVVPSMYADKHIDVRDETYQPTGDLDKLVHETCKYIFMIPNILAHPNYGNVEKSLTPITLDDPELFHGMPVGVQIVGRRLQEERVLALSEVVVDVLKR